MSARPAQLHETLDQAIAEITTAAAEEAAMAEAVNRSSSA